MAPPDATWRVLSHGPLETLAENLWRVTGAVPGMSLRRVMTIARRDSGELVIHNAIALEESAQRAVEALGRPRYLLVPNGYHRLDAPAYKARYPELEVFAPTGSREKVAEALAVNGSYEEFPSGDDVRLETLPGAKQMEGAMLVRSRDGLTLVLNDCVMNMELPRDFLGRTITSLLGSAPGPRVSRLTKWVMVRDKRALRERLEQYAATPELVRVIVAHDKLSSGPEASQVLRQAASYL